MVTFISFIIVIGILIFVHEFGHFIVAKSVGIEVEKFSLGFGPKIIGFKKGETHYMISALPLGGYVKMKGETPDEPLTNDPKEFGSRGVGVRFTTVLAGPLMNYLLAFMLMPLVFIIGIEAPSFLDHQAVIHWIAEGSPAMRAGFERGDSLLSVDGEEVKNWKMFNALIQSRAGKEVTITFLRDGKIHETKFMLDVGTTSSSLGLMPKMPAIVGMVMDNSPAQLAGIKPKDAIVEVAQENIIHWVQMSEVIKKYPGVEIPFTIRRQEQLVSLMITPNAVIEIVEKNSPADIAGLKQGDKVVTLNGGNISKWREALLTGKFPQESRLSLEVTRNETTFTTVIEPRSTEDVGMKIVGQIGIVPLEETVLKKFGVIESFKEGFLQSLEMTGLTLWALGKLLTFQLSIKTLGGPILIAKMTGTAAKSGFPSLLMLATFLTINLAILNLLPIPILDGGHLLFLLIELIIGKPLGVKKVEIAQKIGLVILLVLLLTVTYNDIIRSLPQKYLDYLPWR